MAIHDSYYTNAFRDTVGFHNAVPARKQVEFIARTVPLTPNQPLRRIRRQRVHAYESAAGYNLA